LETARLLDVIAGRDDIDKMSQASATGRLEGAVQNPVERGLRVLWSPDLGYAPVDREVVSIVANTAALLCNSADYELSREPRVFTNANDAWMPIVSHRIRSHLEFLQIWPDRVDEISET